MAPAIHHQSDNYMKNILIIGSTSAIATACARLWADTRARFFVVGRDQAKLTYLVKDLMVRGADACYAYQMDVNRFDDHAVMLDTCFERLGSVNVVLVAHGTLPDQKACETDVNLAVSEFTTNSLSVIALLTRLATRMETQKHGCIAVISSVAGDRGRPSNYLYGTAKAAVNTFCEGLRARLAKSGVHVLTIKPGFVDTPMTQGLNLPAMLVAPPERVARDIVRAEKQRLNILYTPWFWRGVMAIIRNIPANLFKRMNL